MAEPNRYHLGLFITEQPAFESGGAPTYALEFQTQAALESDGQPIGVLLQDGYRSPEQALEALVDALTYAPPDPPDLTLYDDGLAKTSELATAQEEISEALHATIARLEQLEALAAQLLQGAAAPAPTKQNRFLAGGGGGGQAVAAISSPAPTAPPPLRRSRMTISLPEPEQDLGSRVHGQPFGGPSRGRHSS